ncbi:MAG: phosphatase PAP2 family protein [Eubacteriales bacterium]|nr:phosphatase PAP2 family protein [Eubacteriales bacterium]
MDFLRLLEGLRTPFFDTVFQFFTLFGEETLFMVIAMAVFWCIDKKNGYFLLYVCFLGNTINQFLKLLFVVPRPWVLDEKFTIVESARAQATGYSFPSGHTQNSAGLFLGIARSRKETWVRIVCIALTMLVAFSRMYLGVHTPADVLTSLGVALLLVLVAYPLFYRAWNNPKWFIPIVGFLFVVGIALLLFVELVPLPENAIAEFSADGAKTAYTMFGASAGFAFVLWIEQKYIRFSVKAVWWAQILQIALGLAIVIAIRLVLKEPLLSLCGGHNAAHAIRYFLMVAVGGAVWPLTFPFFAKLGRKAEPAA